MELTSLIFVGDLNCTIALEEVCERSRRIDPLVGMFRDALLAHNFLDILPVEMAPTWENGHTSVAYVAKRLDHILMHEHLISLFGDVQKKIISNFLSDHGPITLVWKKLIVHLHMPFKFNRTWLDDLEFNTLVRDTWRCMGDIKSSPMEHIITNWRLSTMK